MELDQASSNMVAGNVPLAEPTAATATLDPEPGSSAGGFMPGFVAAADGYRLMYRRYCSAGRPKAIVIGIHGIQSHAGWYARSCRWLAEGGFEVLFADRRGSGANEADRGHCNNYRQLIDDLVRVVAFARADQPGVPVVLMAISWGGKLAVAALKEHSGLADALVLIGPGWFAKVAPSLREKLAVGCSFLLWPRRQITIPLADPALFTANATWQEYLRADPLSLHQGTARLLFTSRVLDSVIARAPQTINVPSLLMLGGQDRIIDNAKVKAHFARFAAVDRTILEYADAHHTLEFEPNPRPIFADLIHWLAQRFGSV